MSITVVIVIESIRILLRNLVEEGPSFTYKINVLLAESCAYPLHF